MRRRFLSSQKHFDPSNYMTIEVLEDGFYVSFKRDIEYNRNGEGWKTLRADFNSPILNKGEFISFRLALPKGESIGRISSNSKLVNLRGNILSIVFGDNIVSTLEGYDYVFRESFLGWQILNIEKNFLPATTLAGYCYKGMFINCTSLTSVPELPATTLAGGCYGYMFSGCSSLTTSPALPATTLADYCYSNMFSGCSSLTTAPELPATKLADHCYGYMFQRCTSLTTAPALPATTLADSCYYFMFYGCSSLTTAPELRATTLTNDCYRRMFYNCKNLNYIKMLATDISATECLDNWVYNVASTGTFVKNPNMTGLPTGPSGIPSGWTVINDGEDSGNLITFTIDGTEYQAEEGMTWEEWINSEYNIDMTFGIDEFEGTSITNGSTCIGTLTEYVEPSDLIIANYEYILTW